MTPEASPGAQPTFFKEGLRFSCTDCGRCCTGAPGVVLISPEDLERIADYLDMPPEAFYDAHVRTVPDGDSLMEHPNGDCEFFVGGRCSIHPVKPAQCRLYPFWFGNLRSEAAWHKTSLDCPGIGQGRHYEKEEILALISEDLERREKMGLVRGRENRTIPES